MTSHDKIELPPLPTIDVMGQLRPQIWFTATEVDVLRLAAIEADRKSNNTVVAHGWIRAALELDAEAPYRFDFYAQEIEKLRNARDYRNRQAMSGTETLRYLSEVLQYLENEAMKLEAAYGHNFKPHATEKARATVEKLKEVIYTISNTYSKRRGDPVGEIYCRIYHDTEQHRDYLKARFHPDTLKNRVSFEWQGHRWAYRYTHFDDSGEYDLIARTAPQPAEPVVADAPVKVDTKASVPSDIELDDLADVFHGFAGNYTRYGYPIPKFNHVGYARAILERYGHDGQVTDKGEEL